MSKSKSANIITTYLLEDFNGVFEKLKSSIYNNFSSFITYLNDPSTIRIQPTKEQFLILKELFTKFKDEPNINQLQSILISTFGGYLPSCYTKAEQRYIYELLFKTILSTTPSAAPQIDKSILINTLDTNLENFDNELILKINEIIYDYILTNYQNDPECFLLLIYYIKLLFKVKSNGNSDDNYIVGKQYEEQEIKIKNFISTSISIIFDTFKNYGFNTKKTPIIQSFEITEFILNSVINNNGTTTSNNKDYSIYLNLLTFQNKTSSINYQIKYKDQLIEAFKNDSSIFGFKKIERNQEEILRIFKILIDKQEFNMSGFKQMSLTSFYLTATKITRTGIEEPSRKKISDDLNRTFCEYDNENGLLIGFDTVLSIIQILFEIKSIKESNIESFLNEVIMLYVDNGNEDRNRIKSAFNIDENLFKFKLHQDEYKLLDIYHCYFNAIVNTIDMEAMLPILFNNLKSSPMKLRFLKTKIDYLIQLLNLNSIQLWILPNFKEQCENSEIYKYKLLNRINGEEDIKVPVQLSHVIIQNIILQYTENPSTSMYQKLQLSLVSKKFNEIVIGFINSSITIPVPISDFRHNMKGIINSESYKYSLFKPESCKYIKHSMESMKSHVALNNFRFILNNCKSLEILHIDGLYFEYNKLFVYLCWYTKLTKLIIRTSCDTFINCKITKLVTSLKNQNKNIQVDLSLDSLDFDLDTTLPINYKDIKKAEIPIDDYFHHGCFKNKKYGIYNLNYLKLSMLEYNEPTSVIKYSKKYLNCDWGDDDNSNKLSSLQILDLELNINNNFVDLIHYLLKFFGNNVSSNLKEIILSRDARFFRFPESLEIFFKYISNMPQLKSVEKIIVSNYYSPDTKHWEPFNTFKFTQQVYNSSTVNSIEFIRLNNQEDIAIECLEICDDDSEVDFDTDSDYDQDFDEDEDEDQYDEEDEDEDQYDEDDEDEDQYDEDDDEEILSSSSSSSLSSNGY